MNYLYINKEWEEEKDLSIIKQKKKESKQARRNQAKLLRETKWYCEICQREYTLGGKHMHVKTAKHSKNFNNKPLIEVRL